MCTKALLLAGVVLFSTMLTTQGQTIAVAYRYVDEYSFIWSDRGSGANRDVSIWRPFEIESGYFSLGDVATSSHSKPNIPALSVSAVVSNALAPPTGFTEIWNDRGSGASRDVRVMKMNPRRGYTCLGHVAIEGYNSVPNRNLYRCVKSNYVDANSGTYDLIWKDRGSGARVDVGLWTNTNIGSDSGIEASTFTAFATHNSPSGRPSLLSSVTAKLSSLIPISRSDNVAIILYQVTDTERIWKDSGSGAKRDFSSYRAREPDGYYSLGDIGVRSHSKPRFSVLAKARKSDALKAPVGFRQRWNDRGSGARDDVAFYEPICPGGYRVLGYVTIESHSARPSKRDIRCVKSSYTVTGKWEWVWNDRGSGARKDVTVWKAVPDRSGQGVLAMSARPCHCNMDRTAYVLNPAYVTYIVSKPVRRYLLNSISYKLDQRNILSQTPEIIGHTTACNLGDTVGTATRSIVHTYEETFTWSTTEGLEIGVSITVTAGVPEVFSGSTTVSTAATFSYTTEKSATNTTTDSISAIIEVQPHSSKAVIIVSNRYVMDVPYTANVTPEYADGTRGSSYTYSGVFEGVQVNKVHVTLGADVPLTPESFQNMECIII